MAEESTSRRESASGLLTIIAKLALVAALALLALVAVGCRAEPTTRRGSAEETEPVPSAPATGTLQLKVGETYRASGVAIRVVSAGPANLPPQMSPVPEGMKRVAVRATFANEGDRALPLNATPYSAYTTSLVVDGASYEGALFSGSVAEVRDGTIPAGRELNLRFVFEVPEGSTAATFVWPPAHVDAGFPRLEVPIADVSRNS